MLDKIKTHWYQLKTEYENIYREPFLRDFEKSKLYLEKMKNYLLAIQEDYPSNVDVICTLASVMLELRDSESDCIKLLNDFLIRFGFTFDNVQKARIYTNIAFYYDYSKDTLEYLNKAYELKSPFAETYTALGLYYFSEYQFYKTEKNLSLSKKYFEIANDIDESYNCAFNYAVCLYELKEYEKAKKIFTDLLKKYPERMRLKLCISYCETYLGNKEKAVFYLNQIKSGQDDNYYLHIDDIADYEIFNAYYALEEYDTFLICVNEEVLDDYYTSDWAHYFYILWLKNERELFYKLEKKNRTYFEETIKKFETDEDYDSEEEKQETISDLKKDAREFEEMIECIKAGCSKPIVQLELYPEFSCFMVDCVRHKF